MELAWAEKFGSYGFLEVSLVQINIKGFLSEPVISYGYKLFSSLWLYQEIFFEFLFSTAHFFIVFCWHFIDFAFKKTKTDTILLSISPTRLLHSMPHECHHKILGEAAFHILKMHPNRRFCFCHILFVERNLVVYLGFLTLFILWSEINSLNIISNIKFEKPILPKSPLSSKTIRTRK